MKQNTADPLFHAGSQIQSIELINPQDFIYSKRKEHYCLIIECFPHHQYPVP